MEDTIGTPINFANKVVTERRVPSRVHAFLYNREKVINRLFAGAAEKKAGGAAGQAKNFLLKFRKRGTK